MEIQPLRPGEVVESTDMVGMARLCLYINEHGKDNVQSSILHDDWETNDPITLDLTCFRYRIKPPPIERWVVVAESGAEITCYTRKAAEQEIAAEWTGYARIVHLVEAPIESEEDEE